MSRVALTLSAVEVRLTAENPPGGEGFIALGRFSSVMAILFPVTQNQGPTQPSPSEVENQNG